MTEVRRTSRRRFLAGAAGLVGGGIIVASARPTAIGPAAAAAPQPAINPRRTWAQDLQPTGPLPVEGPGDVRFLLVHHTAGVNGYAKAEVGEILRGIYRYHTGPKGWNDVAYNFFVDAHGGIWEGRQGSLEAPVIGDATGGSQGFAQLCCFMGDHREVPPTAAAQAAMADLLAWLAGRYSVDLRAGAAATFVSRGSNLHPAGTRVTTPTIAAHRDMSKTTCPGDACYRLVKGSLAQAAATKAGAAALLLPPPGGTATAPGVSAPGPGDPGAAGTTASTLPPASPTLLDEDDLLLPTTTAPPPPLEGGAPSSEGTVALGIGGAAAVGAIGGALLLRRRRRRAEAAAVWHRSELLNPAEPGAPARAPSERPEGDPPTR